MLLILITNKTFILYQFWENYVISCLGVTNYRGKEYTQVCTPKIYHLSKKLFHFY